MHAVVNTWQHVPNVSDCVRKRTTYRYKQAGRVVSTSLQAVRVSFESNRHTTKVYRCGKVLACFRVVQTLHGDETGGSRRRPFVPIDQATPGHIPRLSVSTRVHGPAPLHASPPLRPPRAEKKPCSTSQLHASAARLKKLLGKPVHAHYPGTDIILTN